MHFSCAGSMRLLPLLLIAIAPFGCCACSVIYRAPLLRGPLSGWNTEAEKDGPQVNYTARTRTGRSDDSGSLSAHLQHIGSDSLKQSGQAERDGSPTPARIAKASAAGSAGPDMRHYRTGYASLDDKTLTDACCTHATISLGAGPQHCSYGAKQNDIHT